MNPESFAKYFLPLLIVVSVLCSFHSLAQAQDDLTASSQSITVRVLGADGSIFLSTPPGRLGVDPSFSFYDKSFFSAKIGDNVYSNNNVIAPKPSNMTVLTVPNVQTISNNTIHTEWTNHSGVDIIQDVNVDQSTGNIYTRWSFRNISSQDITASCQWLLDLMISDPSETRRFGAVDNANDAPTVLTPIDSFKIWKQYPNSISPNVPNSFSAFLYDPPGPTGGLGLGMEGVLSDKTLGFESSTVTVGDWYTLATSPFGHDAAWANKIGLNLGDDDGMLVEYAAITIPAGQTVQAGGIIIRKAGTVQSSVPAGVLTGGLAIHSIIPNPVSDRSTLSYELPISGLVRATLFDLLGREVKTIANTFQDAGQHSVPFDGEGVANGSYIIRLEFGGQTVSQIVMLER